ncbi:MAG: hypothetical protein ACE5HJ_03195 [Thermoplasmata archaeon]
MGLEAEDVDQKIREARARHGEWHHCKDCDKWYGAEDDEYGPCLYKHARGDEKFVTHGGHGCDEPEELGIRGLL